MPPCGVLWNCLAITAGAGPGFPVGGDASPLEGGRQYMILVVSLRWEATVVLGLQSSHASCSSTVCDGDDKHDELITFVEDHSSFAIRNLHDIITKNI